MRRWLFIVSLLFCFTASYSQAIKKVEYFFDIDPGFGNGKQINLNNNQLIDSTFNFDISALSNGVHIVYIRAQDDAQKWSLYYSTAFVKTAGNDSAIVINKLEYFIDVDPGFGNGINVPVQQANIIDSTFNFQIPDNGADTRRLYIRAQDSKGQWSLLYDTTINLCQLYKVRANFSWVRFANLYSFIDSSQNNISHKVLWNFHDLGIDSVSNPQFTFPQGNHFVKLVAGTGCRKDSIVLPLFTGLEKYFPDTALAGGDIFMNFYGGGLDTNVVVTLKNGSANITSYAKVAYQQQFFTGAFDLHTATPGVYDVNLHFANGYDTTIIGGLHVGSIPTGIVNYSPELELSILGPEVGRGGTTVTQRLVITNTGGMVAKSINVWSSAQNGAEDRPGQGFDTFVKPDNKMNYDSIPTEIALDSSFGEPYQGKLHNFMIPALNAGQSFVYSYTLKVPLVHGDVNYVDFWVGKRMFGSPNEWDCTHQVLDDAFNVAGLLPVVGCAFSVAGFALDFTSGMAGQFGYNTDRSYDNLGNMMWGFASAAWGCIPGVKTVEEAAKIADASVRQINITKRMVDAGLGGLNSTMNHDANPCEDKNDAVDRYRKGIRGRVAADPNGIDGPGGYGGDNNYITGLGKQGYEVYFENLPTATANAQRIYVADTLDKTKFDLSSFELIGFSLADSFFHIPYQRKEFTTTMDLRPGMNLLLRVNAKLDTSTGILNYSFLSLDPVTRDTLPLSDLRGFLPPDVNDKNGKGSISYVVNYKKNIVTNDIVTNKASIIFDNNAPIITNTWLNTIDRTAPAGGVSGGTKVNDTTVTLNFKGTDLGVGIRRYKLYGAQNNNPYVLLGNVLGGTVRFAGSLDSTYRFYAIPFDSVNNFLSKDTTAEYTITLKASGCIPPVITASRATTICLGDSVILSTTATATSLQWLKDGAIISGATAQSYVIKQSGSYSLRAVINSCTATSSAIVVTVTVVAATPIITASGTTTFCQGGSVVLSTTSTATLQWFKDGTAISGATTQNYTATQSGSYTVRAGDGTCTATSSAIVVTVTAVAATPIITASGATTFCQGGSVVLSTTSTATLQWLKDGIAISGATTQNYTATQSGSYTVRAGDGTCTAPSSAIVVTVTADAATPIITASGATTFCQGGSVVLSSSSSSGNQWYKDGTIINGATNQTYTANQSGSYTVTTTVNNCSSSPSSSITVVVNTIPAKPVITVNGNTLTSSYATDNQWYLNGTIIAGAVNQQYVALVSGQYTVQALQNGCASATSDIFDLVSLQTPDPYTLSDVLIYPNPVRDKLTINNKANRKLSIKFINMQGVVVLYAGNLFTTLGIIDMKKLSQGAYVIEVTDIVTSQFINKIIIKLD
ncbi:MAG TPA: T9SS type A sorting domain-containing protein [Chitinophagaceae bacterium]